MSDVGFWFLVGVLVLCVLPLNLAKTLHYSGGMSSSVADSFVSGNEDSEFRFLFL